MASQRGPGQPRVACRNHLRLKPRTTRRRLEQRRVAPRTASQAAREHDMSSTGFAYPGLLGKKLPPPAPRWAGNARYNFIGGHNDRSLIPIEGLIEATA